MTLKNRKYDSPALFAVAIPLRAIVASESSRYSAKQKGNQDDIGNLRLTLRFSYCLAVFKRHQETKKISGKYWGWKK